jgi:hypothetical protein
MPMMKRSVVWLSETVLEALLLSVVLVCLLGDKEHRYAKDLAVSFVWIGTMFFSTGYLFTTLIARAALRGRFMWLYPGVALVLFFIHFEILNHSAGGIFDVAKRAPIRIAGACIVLVCTSVGTLLLRRWTLTTANRLKPDLDR